MAHLPNKPCPTCKRPTDLPIVLVSEDNGRNLIVFAGFCIQCKLVERKQSVYKAFTITRTEYLNFRKMGIKVTGDA